MPSSLLITFSVGVADFGEDLRGRVAQRQSRMRPSHGRAGEAHRRPQLLDRAQRGMWCVPEEFPLPQRLVGEHLRVIANRGTWHPRPLEVVHNGPRGPGCGDLLDGLDELFSTLLPCVSISVSRVVPQ